MSDIWNKIIGELNNLGDTIAEKSEEYFKIAVEKGEKLSKKGKIQFEIESSKRELRKEQIAFGEFVANKYHDENVTDFTLNDQFQILANKILNLKKVIASLEKEKQNARNKTDKNDYHDPEIFIPKKRKNKNILSLTIIFIISFIALIIILDTFQRPISKVIPNIEFILYNLYETINDIMLFLAKMA